MDEKNTVIEAIRNAGEPVNASKVADTSLTAVVPPNKQKGTAGIRPCLFVCPLTRHASGSL